MLNPLSIVWSVRFHFKENNLLEANHDNKHWLDLHHLLKQPAFIYCSIAEFNTRVLRM